jgi:hypothetical protein
MSWKWQSDGAIVLQLFQAGIHMQSRKLHGLIAFALFLVAATVYAVLSEQPVDLWRVAVWSLVGVASYMVLSRVFGFDPHRTRIAAAAPAYLHYVDRWELRLGQATLSMLGGIVVAARLFDADHFVTAVVSGTLSAWTYFAFRLYAGGYCARAGASRTSS